MAEKSPIACTALIANKMAIAKQDEGSKVNQKSIVFGSWKNDELETEEKSIMPKQSDTI